MYSSKIPKIGYCDQQLYWAIFVNEPKFLLQPWTCHKLSSSFLVLILLASMERCIRLPHQQTTPWIPRHDEKSTFIGCFPIVRTFCGSGSRNLPCQCTWGSAHWDGSIQLQFPWDNRQSTTSTQSGSQFWTCGLVLDIQHKRRGCNFFHQSGNGRGFHKFHHGIAQWRT